MTLGQVLDRCQGVRALIIGDLMLDEYIVGRATRVSPEAPVLVIRQESSFAVPGGAANVARNVAALGGEAMLVGLVGDDAAGATLGSALSESIGESAWLVREEGRPTTRKTRVMAGHTHQIVRIDHETVRPITPETEEALLREAERALGQSDVLILSDYEKGVLVPTLTQRLIAAAQSQRIPTVVNAKPATLGSYAGASLVQVNRAEASAALGLREPMEDADAEAALATLQERFGLEGVVITLGPSGMAARRDRTLRVAAPRVEVYDTAGAGDTVLATLALGLASSGFTPEVLALAAATSAAVVAKSGVAAPDTADLLRIREAR